jgi:hypothetical protein
MKTFKDQIDDVWTGMSNAIRNLVATYGQDKVEEAIRDSWNCPGDAIYVGGDGKVCFNGTADDVAEAVDELVEMFA